MSLILISIIIISGCEEVTEITPQNVDPVANEIQSKYDGISAYESRIYQIRDDGSIKAGRIAAKKSGHYFDFAYWEGDTFISKVEVCNGQKDEIYTADSGEISTYDRDCKVKVDKIFNVIDRIKKIANYQNTVKQIELNYANGDYKEVSYFGPRSSYDEDKFKILVTSSGGFSVAERTVSGPLENNAGVEVVFTDETDHTYKLIFVASNYQLVKSEKTSPAGKTEVTYYADIQFDGDVNENYFVMPSLEDINKVKQSYE